ncbi:FAD-dependent 5-carboxymethylaminomethyl-2-thiouridine(34) oxidoreductase MnmC [Rugamonas sp.]|uniref:FAD-dependent 5-carboxymethylaminomethyl-2-thiouridine(34) oxidoreductase MnmC n=1 Tax=Rugamonas sp. TaxID=1926287 RepID=UPI0025E0FC12|nr:FAD-dependent 5-carboxymethylaminomethyl-2-thiouridine(34) oxidoreductase MnmC [Rugamonas sp.]
MTRRVVLDTEFGHGERFLAEWRPLPQQGMLHYLAVTPQVPSVDAMAAVLADPLADAQLRALWPLNVPGFHRILLDDGRVTLDLLVGALVAVLPQIAARVDAFHVAASFPAALARSLSKLAVLGATLDAQSPDEALAWALTSAGFACQAVDGTHDLRAVYQGRKPQAEAPPEPVRRAIVIGAGLAGSSACQRLCASGWQVTLVERHAAPAQEASGNLAGIFMPLLSKDDNIPTRLSRAAYLHALRLWQRLGGVGTAFSGARCGVLQLARDAAHAQVQRDVIAAWNYPADYARWLDAAAAGALLGRATPHGGWLFGQGGWVHPASLCAALLAACGAQLQRVFCAEALTLHRVGDEWQVHGQPQPGGATLIAQAPTVVLANGTGARALAQSADLPLSALRGQVTHLAAATMPALPLVVCREAYVTPAGNGIVSAGATYDNDDDPLLRAASQHENLERVAEILDGVDVAGAPLAGRVGFRCAAPDRLPLAGALPDYPNAGRLERLRDVPRHPGLYGLLGYASRGLIWAPLMAELLVSQLEGAPPPLEVSLAAALDPGRFLLKARRRSQ